MTSQHGGRPDGRTDEATGNRAGPVRCLCGPLGAARAVGDVKALATSINRCRRPRREARPRAAGAAFFAVRRRQQRHLPTDRRFKSQTNDATLWYPPNPTQPDHTRTQSRYTELHSGSNLHTVFFFGGGQQWSFYGNEILYTVAY